MKSWKTKDSLLVLLRCIKAGDGEHNGALTFLGVNDTGHQLFFEMSLRGGNFFLW